MISNHILKTSLKEYHLAITYGNNEKELYLFNRFREKESSVITVGIRSVEDAHGDPCDIVLNELFRNHLSRHHCTIYLKNCKKNSKKIKINIPTL